MATSKTLTPTNVTISIPAMTDSPDASVFSNCVDKEADAINALNSKITNSNMTTLSADGLECTYIVRSGFCYVLISGYPTTTDNITFTLPKAFIGAYVTCGQWASTSNQIQVFIDTNTTTLTVRNHNATSVKVTLSYPVA